MRNTHMEIRPMSGALGAEILGVDLAAGADDGTFARIRAAFLEHGVIVIRDQDLTPEQHLALARRFGPINVNRFFTPVDGHPEVAEVRKEPDQTQNIGGRWHTDHSYDEAPALGSMIYALEVPPVGGDTLFANMGLAFESLSDGMKAMLEELEAVHSSRHVFGPGYKSNPDLKDRFRNAEQAVQDTVHPVVIRHPETGRRVLYVNPIFTVRFDGWTEEESKPAARLPLRARRETRVLLPGAVGEGLARPVGQPGDVAHRAQRLPWAPQTDAPGDDRGDDAVRLKSSVPRSPAEAGRESFEDEYGLIPYAPTSIIHLSAANIATYTRR